MPDPAVTSYGSRARRDLRSDEYPSKAHLPSRGVEREDLRTCALPAPLPGGPGRR